MIKRICIIGLVLCLVTTIVCANPMSDFRVSRFNDLVNLSVIPQEYSNIDLNTSIKRSEALELLLIIGTGNPKEVQKSTEFYKNQDFLLDEFNWKYTDIHNETKDCSLTVYATLLYIMKGECTENPNERIARMDDFITWEECLTFVMRILYMDGGMRYETVEDALSDYKKDHPEDEPLLLMAEDLGLINKDNIAYYSAIHLVKDDLNKAVTWREFSEIAYRMLYIPITTYGCAGVFDRYMIDDFKQ